jgi:hypothetical protein
MLIPNGLSVGHVRPLTMGRCRSELANTFFRSFGTPSLWKTHET